MRLEVLNSGYTFGAKVFFALIRLASGRPLPDAARVVFYRPDFYGDLARRLTHEAMRGPSEWSVADRELMAAYVSKMNECRFCIAAHTATAEQASDDEERVEAVLSDLEAAPIDERLRATLRMLGKLTLEHEVTAADMREVLDSGASIQDVKDALAVCCAFDITNRLADAFGFHVAGPKDFEAGAKFLLQRGYR